MATSSRADLKRPRRRARLAAMFFLSASLPLAPAGAQEPEQTPAQQTPQQTEPGFRVQARVERVNVDVTVTDARGQSVSGLKREQFRVLDNSVEQSVVDFTPIDAPVRALLIVEMSPAVYLLGEEHQIAALRLLEGLNAGDYVAFATYSDSLRPVLGFTQDKAVVAQALRQLQFGLGFARLNLFGSLSSAIQDILVTPPPDPSRGGKTAIVLLSTGLSDVQTEAVRQQLGGELEVSGIAVYTIALGGDLRSPRGKTAGAQAAAQAFTQADSDLRIIAESSGGLAFFPKTGKDLAGAYAEVAQTLRHLYSLAIVPPAHDGKVHTLKVDITDGKKDWRILARPAYLAPNQ